MGKGVMNSQADHSTQTSNATAGAETVGTGEYIIQSGECIESIAYERGFFWQTIWDDANNAELKRVRKDANIVLAGDKLHIPEKRLKQVSGGTEKRHRFHRKGIPAMLRLILRAQGKPRANTSYTLVIDGQAYKGTTDANGKLEHSLPPNAAEATLKVESDPHELTLTLRHMDPVESLTGVQARLANLGYDVGNEGGTFGTKSRTALRQFQEKNNLKVTGDADTTTSNKLKELHGC